MSTAVPHRLWIGAFTGASPYSACTFTSKGCKHAAGPALQRQAMSAQPQSAHVYKHRGSQCPKLARVIPIG